MNKKLVYLFAVLVLGLFVISACEQAVGRRVVNRNAVGDDNVGQGNLQAQQVNPSSNTDSLLGVPISCSCTDHLGCTGSLESNRDGIYADCTCCSKLVSDDE